MASAAAATVAEVFGFVIGLEDVPGLSGSGGGARSGSELSHLQLRISECQQHTNMCLT